MTNDTLYVGINGTVVALDADTGLERWRTPLNKGATVTTILQRGERLIAAAAGELWCLDAADGVVVWHNKMKGMGLGVVTICGGTNPAAGAYGGDDGSTAAMLAAVSASGADCGDAGADGGGGGCD